MSELSFAEDLWDKYRDLARRFDQGNRGTSSLASVISSQMDMQRNIQKRLGKMRPKIEDYGRLGEAMVKLQEFLQLIGTARGTFCESLGDCRQVLNQKSRELTRQMKSLNRREKKYVSDFNAAKANANAAKRKDAGEGQKWERARNELTSAQQAQPVVEKKVTAARRKVTAAQNSSEKAKASYRTAIENLHTANETYYTELRGLMGEMQGFDTDRIAYTKQQLVAVADGFIAMTTSLRDGAVALKQSVEEIDPEAYVQTYIETAKSDEERPEPATFAPFNPDDENGETALLTGGTAVEVAETASASSGSSSKKPRGRGRRGRGGSAPKKETFVGQCRAKYDYDPSTQTDPDDGRDYLHLKSGEVIDVLEKNKGGWWLGRSRTGDRQKGFFPENFVEEVAEQGTSDTPKKEATTGPAAPAPRAAVVEGPDDDDGDEEEGESELEALGTCNAKFDYAGKTESEMSFKQGDEITIFTKNDDGWWYGETAGARAYFPVNFTDAWTGD